MKKKITVRNFFGALFLVLGLLMIYDGVFNRVDWTKADRNSVGIAPKPSEVKEAVVLVYAARAFSWRKYLAVHSWIAVKEKDADHYTTYQVSGWALRRSKTSIMKANEVPDRRWFGQDPELIQELRGESAEKAIPEIKKAVADYPYAHTYVAWPGPNSNTFISYIIRQVPELNTSLPPTAIGKDFLGRRTFFAESETGTGWQVSLWGALGLTVGFKDGIEFNLFGFNFGLDFLRPAIKLPFLGRIGMSANEY
jgi:hypothetical protein